MYYVLLKLAGFAIIINTAVQNRVFRTVRSDILLGKQGFNNALADTGKLRAAGVFPTAKIQEALPATIQYFKTQLRLMAI